MHVLTLQAHKVLDFVTVVAFALAPTLIPLNGLAAAVAYGLAVVHLAVTLATEFTGAGRRPLPLRGHGAIEAVVGITLLVLPFVTGWIGRPRIFYLAAGAVILIVWALSGYPPAQSAAE
jgi:hypothetical protein